MLDITDKTQKPEISELCDYVNNQQFNQLLSHLSNEYNALNAVEYSCDNILLGWNIKLYKSGRALCRLYPRKGYFYVLIVIGRKEKERTEALMPSMSEEMRKIYESTKDGMGQRWLVFDLNEDGVLYQDFLKLVEIRRNSR